MADEMHACTFFGHRDSPDTVREKLRVELRRIVEQEGILNFYVGNHGKFDAMVKSELIRLKKEYNEISILIVFAYFPWEKQEQELENVESIYPNGIERIPKRFCISWRNKWMIRHSDMIITYVKRTYGGASQFADYAKKEGKRVINLAESNKK